MIINGIHHDTVKHSDGKWYFRGNPVVHAFVHENLKNWPRQKDILYDMNSIARDYHDGRFTTDEYVEFSILSGCSINFLFKVFNPGDFSYQFEGDEHV